MLTLDKYFLLSFLKKVPFGTIGLGNPYSTTKIFEKAYAMSRQKPSQGSYFLCPPLLLLLQPCKPTLPDWLCHGFQSGGQKDKDVYVMLDC